jgi:hypothetical protein
MPFSALTHTVSTRPMPILNTPCPD